MDELNQIEEDLRKSDQKKRKSGHKVSGKSVFKLQEIIKEKSEKKKDGHDGTSPETMAGDN